MVPTPVKYFKDENGREKQVKYASKIEKELIAENKLSTSQKTFFSLKPVYDITQTNAKPEDYPKIYPNGRVDFDVTDKNIVKDILQATERYLESNNIPVRSENYSLIGMGAAKGYYSPSENRISLNRLNTDTENMTVLIHETAHAIMHGDDSNMTSTPVKEFEAELTSYVVNKHFGIDTSSFSNEYIAQWTHKLTNVKDVETSLKNISSASTQIIEGIEENLELEQEIALEKKMDQVLEDRNEIRLTLSQYDYNDYVGMLDAHADLLKEKFKSDNIYIKKGTETKLPDQNDTLLVDKNYLVIENQSDITGEDLKDLQYNTWKDIALSEGERTGKHFSISAMYLVIAEDDHLTIENSIAKSTDLDLKGKSGEELEFYKKAIEVFDKTNNGMTIDNLSFENDMPISFEDFRSLHEEIEAMMSQGTEKDNNNLSREGVERDYVVPVQQLEMMARKFGMDKEGKLKQPVIHLPEENLVTTLKAFSSSLSSGYNEREKFEYGLYTHQDQPLYLGQYDTKENKSLIETLKTDAEKNDKSAELNEVFKQVREQNKQKTMEMELTKAPIK